jgi:hypothetical protein
MNEKELKKKHGDGLVFIDNEDTDTQGFMVIKGAGQSLCTCGNTCSTCSVCSTCSNTGPKGTLIISFRGSQQTQDWINDFNAWHTIVPYGNYASDIRVHQGFLKCYKSVRDRILEYIQKHRDEIGVIFVTGHSLGGALATLCAVDIQYNYSIYLEVYTSGAPAVGNKAFARSYNRRVPDTTRTYMRRDIVPKLPPWWFGLKLKGGYKHVQKGYAIGPKSFWYGLKYFFKVGKKFAENITNHSIDLYRKWC